MSRTFEFNPAVRSSQHLLIGITGPSFSGKTYSALRLATGMVRVTGGTVFVLDTENGRACHYAPAPRTAPGQGTFAFTHVPFAAPFSPLDYLSALEQCAKAGASVIVVDSASHEHEGPGGILEWHSELLEKRSGGDWKKAERISFQCWGEPKAAERRLLNTIGQLGCHVIMCFRAKEKTRPPTEREKDSGQRDLVKLGWMPIASPEFVYELGVNFPLPASSNGVVEWRKDPLGETTYKRPEWAKQFLPDGVQLTEELGERLASWARGEKSETDSMLENIASAPTLGELNMLAEQLKLASQTLPQATVAKARAAWKKRRDELQAAEPEEPNPAG